MAFEFIDLKGFLFVVLLSIPLTSSANIDCGGKPFHCLNSTHFMICVDLGGGVSTTIDDFIIPCPPTTMCQKGNRFECEFPKVEVTTMPPYVIRIPEEIEKRVLPQSMDSVITIPPVEMTTVLSVTEKSTATILATQEETLPFNNEILESLKEEFTGGNEKIFEGDTITSTTTVSSSYSIDEINLKNPKLYVIMNPTDNYNHFKLHSDNLTANVMEATETGMLKLKDTHPSADGLPTISANVSIDNSNIQIDLHETKDSSINYFYTFNQTIQTSTNEPTRTLDTFVKHLEITTTPSYSVEQSSMINKYPALNDTSHYVVSLQNSSTSAALLETVNEITIDALIPSEKVFETTTTYSDRHNVEFYIETETKDNNSFPVELVNQNITKVLNDTIEFSSEIPKIVDQQKNVTSNQILPSKNSATVRPMEINTANLPVALSSDSGINDLNEAHTIVKSDIFLNHTPFNDSLKDGIDMSAKVNTEINLQNNNIFNDGTLNSNINATYEDLQIKNPDIKITEEVIANDITYFTDKPSITEHTFNFMHTNFGQPQTSKFRTIFETTNSNNKQTIVPESLTTAINEQAIFTENHFNSNLVIEDSTKSATALEESIGYFTKKEEPVKIEPLNHTYVASTTLPKNNTIDAKTISIEVVESTISLPATIKDAIQNVTPAPQFAAIAGHSSITNGEDYIIAGKESFATQTGLEKNISFTTIGSNNTILIVSNDGHNLSTDRSTINTTVNKSHITESESSKLTTTQGSYNVDNIVNNGTFIHYIEDINALNPDYGTENGTTRNISMNADISQFVVNVTQRQNSVNESIFAVQNDDPNLKRFENINLNNDFNKQNETIVMKTVQEMVKYQDAHELNFSTVVSVIKPLRPEYITESIFLPNPSTEAPLLTATITGHKKNIFPKDDILSKNSKQDIGITKTSQKYIYSNIPDIIVSPIPDISDTAETMGPNIEPPELVHDLTLKQDTQLPHKSEIKNSKFTLSTTDINELETVFHDNTLVLSTLTGATIKTKTKTTVNRNSSVAKNHTGAPKKLSNMQNFTSNVTNTTVSVNIDLNLVTEPATIVGTFNYALNNTTRISLNDTLLSEIIFSNRTANESYPIIQNTTLANNELSAITNRNLNFAIVNNTLINIINNAKLGDINHNEGSTANYEFPTTYHKIEVTTRSSIVNDENKNTLQNSANSIQNMDNISLLGTTTVSDSNRMAIETQTFKNISPSIKTSTLKNGMKHNFSSVNGSTSTSMLKIDEDQTTDGDKFEISKIKAVSNFTIYQNRSDNDLEQTIESPRGASERTTNLYINYTPTKLMNNELKLTSANAEDLGATINDNKKENNTSSPFNCPKITRGKYADSKDCRKFYTCLGKLEPVLGICPNNTVFSEINKQCTRNLSHCVRNNQFHCLYEGRFSDFLKDNIYYICVKNNLHGFLRYKLQCDNGYHLNKAIMKCEKNIETWNESATSSGNSNISNDPNGSLVNSDVSEKFEKSDFECKKEGNFPYSKDCRKYYMCTKNSKDEYRRKIITCASDEIFDSKKKKCVSSDSEEC